MHSREAELYQRATTGDEASLDALLARYMPQLHAYVHIRLSPALRARESSMDVVQSVCRELLAASPRLEFGGEERFRAWLFNAAFNKIRDKVRRHRGALRDVRREATAEVDFLVAQRLLTPSQDAIADETARALSEALAVLGEDHREVITLARVVGLPHRVIAEVMDRSEEAVRQLLGRALLQLSRELHRRGIDSPES